MFSATSLMLSTSVSTSCNWCRVRVNGCGPAHPRDSPKYLCVLFVCVCVCLSVTVFHGPEEDARELERQLAADQDSVESL